eukprot:CAMPEP_0175906530 /NCGR_PEP_ID=MMETSP0108-20121206/5592_1 /TAXON_ID=195067 ORGANISM="Goniomonas pacifica, Strain CCMP1869" /NCGR_SAMPLE_ID=MMETSP0108 /ASSEMBLY_ACC=CAM_ASM_000204 /LENGTH=154 /DNA_ID=CAMNT_0017228481 /DNA_START=85 /DNA_END=549 /DNA_ORIENTATION=+
MAAGGERARAGKRLQKEYGDLVRAGDFPVRLENQQNVLGKWYVTVRGAAGTLYAGEEFVLQFTFSDQYPLDSPEVVFCHPVPVHPHIYTNGHICLSILYDSWSPALRIESVCRSILSMLSSCAVKEKPADNDEYVRTAKVSPKQTKWVFHDDGV